MFFYVFLGILFELPLYYFALPSKDRRKELVVFVALINLISLPLFFSVMKFSPNMYAALFITILTGLGEGVALKFAYAQHITIKRGLITGVVVNLLSLVFLVFLRPYLA